MTDVKADALERKTKNVYEQMCRMLGTYINKVREEQGISLREMYRRTNISIAVLSDIENGQKLPRIDTLIKLALALDIPLNHIFGSECHTEFVFSNDIRPFKQTKEEMLKSPILHFDLSKDEIKELDNFMDYIKFKRNKKSKS